MIYNSLFYFALTMKKNLFFQTIYKYYVQDVPASAWIRRSSSTQYALLGNERTPVVDTYVVLKKVYNCLFLNF